MIIEEYIKGSEITCGLFKSSEKDYILQDGILYFLEMNSVPGMSKNSIVPRMVQAMGMSLTELITLLIEDASGDITCGCKQKKNTPIK